MLDDPTIFQIMSDVAPTEFSLRQTLSCMTRQYNPNVSLERSNPFKYN